MVCLVLRQTSEDQSAGCGGENRRVDSEISSLLGRSGKGPGTRVRSNLCFRGGNFHRGPLCSGNGQRGDGASWGAAEDDTVRKHENGATGEASEKSQSRHCRHHRPYHGRGKANITARVPGSAGALPRPRSQRKGARLVLAWGAAAFGEGPREAVLPRGERAGWELSWSWSPNPVVGLVRGPPPGGAASRGVGLRSYC